MTGDTPNESDRDAELFVEVDPSGRFGRFDDLLGHRAVRKVYRAYDREEATGVAWNQVPLGYVSSDAMFVNRICPEVELLSILANKYIIRCYTVWKDEENNRLNFVTEVCPSGNLRDYRDTHPHVSMEVLKKWAKQILKGLEYLHAYDPCIIHRDLNCSNIFLIGNTGQVKIGDLSAAVIVGNCGEAHSVIGTPEYMAPEMYEENYTELVDIYAFGMCLLEMVTLEVPYSECVSNAEIYKKVTRGIQPQALDRVIYPEVKKLIEKCIAQPRARPSASNLLKNVFFSDLCDDEIYP